MRFKSRFNELGLTLAIGISSAFGASDRPNILWLTSEDNSAHYMSFMGDKNSKLPVLDQLAKDGVVYNNAFANGPVCSVARSTLLYGAYAPKYGIQNHRSKVKMPEGVKTYVEYLRDAGYFCTNNPKTDYNSAIDHKAIWDECSTKAHYSHRKDKNQPFFAVFNYAITHECNLFPSVIEKNRKRGLIPQTPRVSPNDVELPPYYPDTPEIRNDIAVYYDCIENLDSDIGKRIQELKKFGEDENTIIFYYSDHGGILPREKRYLNDTGTRVPLIVYFPEKWRHLAPKEARVDGLVSFVDLAPTILNLAGAKIPSDMDGKPFLGKGADANSKYVFTYADRFDGNDESLRRGVNDTQFRYIYNFYPQNPYLMDCEYQFGQKGWRSWQEEYKKGNLKDITKIYWTRPQPTEMFFDTKSDKWEVNNLISDEKYSKRISEMKSALKENMLRMRDVGIIPEAMMSQLAEKSTPYDVVADKKFEYGKVLDAAFEASSMSKYDAKRASALLNSNNCAIRYWGLIASQRFAKSLTRAELATISSIATADDNLANRIKACEILTICGIDSEKFLRNILKECKFADQKFKTYSALANVVRLTEEEHKDMKEMEDIMCRHNS